MADPISGYLKNLTTGELKQFFFNPVELSTTLDAIYKDVPINGFMGSPLDYQRTTNFRIPIKLWINALTIAQQGEVSLNRGKAEISEWRNFILSLVAPVGTVKKGFIQGKPPKVLFCWPNYIFMRGVIRGKVEIKGKRFDNKLGVLLEEYSFIFESQNPPLWSSDIRTLGMDIMT